MPRKVRARVFAPRPQLGLLTFVWQFTDAPPLTAATMASREPCVAASSNLRSIVRVWGASHSLAWWCYAVGDRSVILALIFAILSRRVVRQRRSRGGDDYSSEGNQSTCGTLRPLRLLAWFHTHASYAWAARNASRGVVNVTGLCVSCEVPRNDTS